MKRQIIAAALAASASSAAHAATPTAPSPAPIEAARISDVTRELSADSFEGRGPATPAEARTVAYIVAHMKAAGLQPGGERGGWTQDVPLARFEVTGPVKLAVTPQGQAPRSLTQSQEMVVQVLRPVDRVAIASAPMVFVGYGVTAPERGWDDFKGVDLKGKIAVCLINDPDFEAKPGEPVAGAFGGKAETYYGRWTYKYEEAARRGALGLIIIHETAAASYGWNTVKNSNGNAQFDIVRDDPAKAHPLLQGWMQHDLAAELFKAAGLDFEAEKARARSKAFTPAPLRATLSADFAVDHSRIVSHNVLGKVVGRSRPGETILYTAHWDHLGVGAPDAKGDRIYNGAIDNADGVASVLELGRAWAKAPPVARTAVFMTVTAEEKGLLGSEYYASHPVYPLATTVADINIDALSGSGPARDVSVSGDSKGELQDMLAAQAVSEGRSFTPDPDPSAGHFFRSDHFGFAKRGVPALSIESGRDLYQGGAAAGRAKAELYVKERYHQPADQWDPQIDFTGMALDVGLAFRLGRDLASGGRWPGWKADSEFKSVRDETAAQRR